MKKMVWLAVVMTVMAGIGERSVQVADLDVGWIRVADYDPGFLDDPGHMEDPGHVGRRV